MCPKRRIGGCVCHMKAMQKNERRLTYANMGHPEQRDYGTEGLVPLELQ